MATPHDTPNHAPAPIANPVGVPAPLWAVLAITFFGSTGTAVVTNGISFIAEQGLGYGPKHNLVLALAMGLVYTPAAFLSAKVLAYAARKSTAVSPKSLLVKLLLIEAAVCQLPWIAKALAPSLVEPALWVNALVFMIATGLQWPIVESYLSGGRKDKTLRRAVGKFNLAWSSPMVLSFWVMAPLLDGSPFLILALLGATQVLVACFVLALPKRAPSHIDTAHAHPESYESLLRVFRVMLIASYIVIATMAPLLPSIEGRLGISVVMLTPIASTWLIVRVGVFGLMERLHFWHGRWWTPWFGFASLLVGFACTLASPSTGSVAVLVLGLTFVGIGIAVIYCGSLYYALAIGGSDVDSGGTHEGLIGAGYTIGPLLGIVAGAMSGWDPTRSERVSIVLVSLCVTAIMLAGVLRVKR